MNAKFEKWLIDSKLLGGSLLDQTVTRPLSEKAWQAALQSLEVTPDLVELAIGGFNGRGTAFMTLDRADTRAMTAALTAVFNAIKEQAK